MLQNPSQTCKQIQELKALTKAILVHNPLKNNGEMLVCRKMNKRFVFNEEYKWIK